MQLPYAEWALKVPCSPSAVSVRVDSTTFPVQRPRSCRELGAPLPTDTWGLAMVFDQQCVVGWYPTDKDFSGPKHSR